MASSTRFSQLLTISRKSRQITALISTQDWSPAFMVLTMMLIVLPI